MVEQPKENETLRYVDRLIMLNNDSILIGRILIDQKYKVENAVAVYRPLQIIKDEEDVYMRKWIQPSSDDVYIIPMSQILTMATPNPMFVETFGQIISGPYNDYVMQPPEVPDGEPESSDEESAPADDVPKKNDGGPTFH